MKNELMITFDRWKKENDQHGRQAFSRFVMLTFLNSLYSVSDDFIFKGGNLLWHYIKTPRETIDLDLATENLKSHLEIKKLIESTLNLHEEIKFKLREFKELDDQNEIGAAIIIEFETKTGQRNQFSVDIVYALVTDISVIKSTINGTLTRSASIENIIADKLSASHQFKSGNTRMKDFDDLWRISKSSITINSKKLQKILNSRDISPSLDIRWTEFLDEGWKRHSKIYEDIPKDLPFVFNEINEWIIKLIS